MRGFMNLRMAVQAHPRHIRQFLDEPLVLGQLEGLDPLGLKPVRILDSLQRRFPATLGLRHRTHQPMGGITRRRVERRLVVRIEGEGRWETL